MGGIGEVVQTDESLFRGKRKYNRGRLLLGNRNNATAANNNNNNNNNNNGLVQYSSSSSSDDSDSSNDQTQANNNRNYGDRLDGPWIFGIAQRTAEGYEARFFHVQRLDAVTLLPIIWKNVYPGTTIWSDEWKAYSRLQPTYGYDHQTVNHSQNFIDPHTGCHTQLIETLWGAAQTKILRIMRGTNLLDSYLAEFWYRSVHKPMFSSILEDIRRYRTK
ncbi:unnamed protein product [Didymodactylos carnosus]|uniref:ISXO2-like transposase domain-containing protein n=1 Tax=Didymodactylos carnosus TaxID=1234261 RepID=A0A814W3N2_9BILA|nr:unnamed protein product [Didymodactylos carnosus]CAF3960200.1 unnamed protein product [Didymodactylos carnosus]